MEELNELYRRTQTKPISVTQIIDELKETYFPSPKQLRWAEVRHKMDELGKKYGFDPRTMKGIDFKTGELNCL